MRIGILGGGIAGIATAWLLDGPHEVVVFEERDRLGGHADSVTVALQDREVTVDLGAQYTSWQGFPAHGRLLRLAGFGDEALTPAPVSFTVMGADRSAPWLVTPHRPDEERGIRKAIAGEHLEAMGTFLAAAAEFETAEGDWEIPLADLVEPLALGRTLKDEFLYPWLAYIGCCANRDAARLSARAAIAFYVRLAPPAPGHAPVWANPTAGMQPLVERLAEQLRLDSLRIGAAVQEIRREDEGFRVADGRGAATFVDRLVLAIPPYAALPLLVPVPGTGQLRRRLAEFEYTPAAVAVHLDPAYMPADRRHWSTVCLEVHDGWAEASNWYGPIHGVDVFKSWITYREPPADVVARRTFRHLVVTPDCVRARADLAARQGEGGLYFAGSHMTYIDSQESAVLSAAAVARRLAPGSSRLEDLVR